MTGQPDGEGVAGGPGPSQNPEPPAEGCGLADAMPAITAASAAILTTIAAVIATLARNVT